jgi:hypothetical protein
VRGHVPGSSCTPWSNLILWVDLMSQMHLAGSICPPQQPLVRWMTEQPDTEGQCPNPLSARVMFGHFMSRAGSLGNRQHTRRRSARPTPTLGEYCMPSRILVLNLCSIVRLATRSGVLDWPLTSRQTRGYSRKAHHISILPHRFDLDSSKGNGISSVSAQTSVHGMRNLSGAPFFRQQRRMLAFRGG